MELELGPGLKSVFASDCVLCRGQREFCQSAKLMRSNALASRLLSSFGFLEKRFGLLLEMT
jgi:hypothetical protein